MYVRWASALREWLKIYGLMLLVAVPCGSSVAFADPIDRELPTVAGMPASQFVLTAAALAVLGVAIYLHLKR